MYITNTNITAFDKKEQVFSMLEELKKYDIKVKLYYAWLKAKSLVSDLEIDKAYDMIMSSITQSKQDELNRRFGDMTAKKVLIQEAQSFEEEEKIEFGDPFGFNNI